MEKRKLLEWCFILSGSLIILWGTLHIFMIHEITEVLMGSAVNQNYIVLINLSYTGIVIMIDLSGIMVIVSAIKGIKNNEKWAYSLEFSQGILYGIVTFLLIIMQPKVSILGFNPEFILVLAIITDLCISILIIVPLLLLKKDFF